MIIDTKHAEAGVQSESGRTVIVMWAIVTFSAGHELMADDSMTAWHNGFEGVTSHITEVWDQSLHVTDGGKHDKKSVTVTCLESLNPLHCWEEYRGGGGGLFIFNAFVASNHYLTDCYNVKA